MALLKRSQVVILEEGLYDHETIAALKTVTTIKALTTTLVPIYERFCKNKNLDRPLEAFYGLISQSEEMLKCYDYGVANFILIQLPDFLVGFYKSSTKIKTQNNTTAKLQQAERAPLSYIAKYIVSKLIHKNQRRI